MNFKKSHPDELPPRQALVLQYLRTRILETGIPPTMREIAKDLGIRSPNGVLRHLLALQRKGLIKRQAAKARGISLVEGPVALPLAGKISAGRPLMAIEQSEQIDFRTLFARGRYCYVVEGRGLPKAQIGVGDVVIVDGDLSPRSGQPIVRLNGKLALQSRGDTHVAGTIVGVVRRSS